MLVVQPPVLDEMESLERTLGEKLQTTQCIRPAQVRIPSGPAKSNAELGSMVSKEESRDILIEASFNKLSPTTRLQAVNSQHSTSTRRRSSTSSRLDSPFDSLRPSLPSSTTSVNIAVDVPPDLKPADSSRRPSLLNRLRSSISTSGCSSSGTRRPSVQSSDFSLPPEQPEKHFIDAIGMVIPGVCNRSLCGHPLSHFITNWRLCEPIEYNTALADHGITYSDYSKLIIALSNFLGDILNLPKHKPLPVAPWWQSKAWRATKTEEASISILETPTIVPKHNSISESAQQLKIATQQMARLNQLLEEISWNWQQRGLPVVVCVGSYSLFTPNRISESFIQLLHTSRQTSFRTESVVLNRTETRRLSEIDSFAMTDSEEHSVALPRYKFNRRSISMPAISDGTLHHYHHQQQQTHPRDGTKPWPLWPNAIPLRKRESMNRYADRYGVDPYFRAWMRADINLRTRCTSYAKFMMEKEDNPFINTRLEYRIPPPKRKVLWDLLTRGPTTRNGQHLSTTNRATYEHNRRLECRKTVEHGSRLRIARFGFRHPMYPIHTPEMEELGLTSKAYQQIIHTIEGIRQDYNHKPTACPIQRVKAWRKFRRHRTEDGLVKASEYIREVNATDRRVLWTIEKIPGVYDRRFGRGKTEWEISLWNGEDPLELLIQLENWGIIEKKLNINDDD